MLFLNLSLWTIITFEVVLNNYHAFCGIDSNALTYVDGHVLANIDFHVFKYAKECHMSVLKIYFQRIRVGYLDAHKIERRPPFGEYCSERRVGPSTEVFKCLLMFLAVMYMRW